MASYHEQLQRIWRQYEERHGRKAATARDVVTWGVERGLLALPEIDPYDKLAEEMSRALREQYATDSEGRRYRVNHAVRIYKGGVQSTFWAVLDYSPRSFLEKAFAQRRKQIVDDCYQLRIDVNAYNNMQKGRPPIQLVLDFTDDVEELLQSSKKAA